MKILITGASGFLGTKLMNILSRKYRVVGTCFSSSNPTLYRMDITNVDHVEEVIDIELPDLIVHTASIKNSYFCERFKDLAWKINVDGTQNIVKACQAKDIKLMFFSSDYVFDGKKQVYSEDDDLSPLNHCGLTKARAEQIIRENIKNNIILRVPILYGYNGENDKETFVKMVIESLGEHKEIYADNTIVEYPTIIDDVSLCVERLIGRELTGTFHISDESGLTKYELSRLIARIYSKTEEDIIPVEEKDIVAKPQNVRLDADKIKKLGVEFVGIDKGLKIMRLQRSCIFHLMYSVRPDMMVLNENASAFRIRLGKLLGDEYPVDADVVVPIPESGIFAATGYADKAKIPFYHGFIRDYDVGRTLYIHNSQERQHKIKRKLISVSPIFKEKKVVLVDEAIITGKTMKSAVGMVKESGAKEIHIRIPSPPFLYPCEAKLHPKGTLLARQFVTGPKPNNLDIIERNFKEYFNVKSVKFLSINSLKKAIETTYCRCIDCFDGTQRD